jgi:MEDS: MEthanogen/methylotroph, DcmR Sensory domain
MIELEVGGKRERIRPGLHVCQFYNQPNEIIHTALPLMRDGLRGQDKCYFAGSPSRIEEIRKALRTAHFDVDGTTRNGQLQLVGDRSELLSRGRFDPYHLLSTHQALISRSLNEGWQSVRAVLDMSWLTQGVSTPEQILKYEAAADAVFTFQSRPIVALLQYNYSELPGELVVELLKLHPIAVVGRFIKRNPYYLNAEEYMVKIIRRGQQRRQPAPPHHGPAAPAPAS